MRVHHRRPRARCLVLTACALSSAGVAAGCSGGADPVTDVSARSATLNAHGKCDGGTPTPCEYQWRWRKAGDTAWTTGPLHGPVRAATSEAALHEPVSGLVPDTAYEWQIGGGGGGAARRGGRPCASRCPASCGTPPTRGRWGGGARAPPG